MVTPWAPEESIRALICTRHELGLDWAESNWMAVNIIICVMRSSRTFISPPGTDGCCRTDRPTDQVTQWSVVLSSVNELTCLAHRNTGRRGHSVQRWTASERVTNSLSDWPTDLITDWSDGLTPAVSNYTVSLVLFVSAERVLMMILIYIYGHPIRGHSSGWSAGAEVQCKGRASMRFKSHLTSRTLNF